MSNWPSRRRAEASSIIGKGVLHWIRHVREAYYGLYRQKRIGPMEHRKYLRVTNAVEAYARTLLRIGASESEIAAAIGLVVAEVRRLQQYLRGA